jgi:hypothetical protein
LIPNEKTLLLEGNEKVDKTKLDINNPQHQMLIGILTMFVDDFGYHPRELLELLEDSKNQLFFSLMDIYKEKK